MILAEIQGIEILGLENLLLLKERIKMSKNLVFGEKAKMKCFRLYSWETALVRAYIKHIREKKKKEIKNVKG